MGQHKYNPVAIAAKEGKLPPKPKNKELSKREQELLLQKAAENAIRKVVGVAPSDLWKEFFVNEAQDSTR